MKQDSGHVLIPPDVRHPDQTRRTFTVDIAPALAPCPSSGVIAIKSRGTRARFTVTRDDLSKQPNGYLAAWASQLERENCLAPGEGSKLAARIAESVPLDPTAASRLLYPDERQTTAVDIGLQTYLQVVSPLVRERGAPILESPSTLTGTDAALTLTTKAADNLLGYEKTLYSLKPKPGHAGYTIAPVYTDRRLVATGATDRHPAPTTDYLQFPPDAAFYRLFYESWRNDFSALVIAARTPTDLDQATDKLQASGASASCQDVNNEMCLQIPKDVAVNPMISVTVNGDDVLLNRGSRLANAITAAGDKNPGAILPKLRVSKPWNGRAVPLSFDPADAAILTLPLHGGEIVNWR